MATDQDRLDEAKRVYLKAKQEIKELRLKIALATCPLSKGCVVTVMRGEREIKFLVEHIWYATDSSIGGELLDPVIGAATGWAVSGAKIRKSDGKPGKHQAGINSLDFHLEGEVWIEHRPTLPEILGLN